MEYTLPRLPASLIDCELRWVEVHMLQLLVRRHGILWMSFLVLLFSSAGAAKSNFITLRLAKGVQIDAPRGWWIIDEEINRLIETSREALLDIAGLDSDPNDALLFAANSMPRSTYASMRVEFNPEPVTAEEMAEFRAAGKAELQEVQDMMETLMAKALPQQNLALLRTLGVAKEEYSSWPAVSYRYLRTGPKGPVVVDIIQVWRPDGVVRVNLAYRESEATLWKPVIARIKKSITMY